MEKQNPIKEAERYVENAKSTLRTNGELDTETRPHPDIKDYKEAIAQRDKKLLQFVNAGYDTMHITMGYDGLPDKEVCASGIRIANDIIDRCGAMIN